MNITRKSAILYFLFPIFYFLLTSGIACAQAPGAYIPLYNFGGQGDGVSPVAGVTFDRLGNLYGTAPYGGANLSTQGAVAGIVWEVTPSGAYKVVYNFGGAVINADGKSGPDGQSPMAPVTFDSAGNMYGTAYQGGANGLGMIWEMTASGTYKDLHDFGGTVTNANGTAGPDGTDPETGVTLDGAGNLYGTCNFGGPILKGIDSMGGIIWELTAARTYKDLHDFGGTVTNADGATGMDGYNPNVGVTIDSAGNMYGTATAGGANNPDGMVWELTASGTYKDLHDFGGTVTNADGSSGPDGDYPLAGVTFDTAGNMYGTCSVGGPNDGNRFPYEAGMVWEITAPGMYKDLHDFGGTVTNANGTSGPDGQYIIAGVTFDGVGNMYGTADEGGPNQLTRNGGPVGGGMVWEIASSGTYKDLHDFGGNFTSAGGISNPDGANPSAGVTIGAGRLYGTTSLGGAYGYGTNVYGDGIAWELVVPPIAPNLTATAGNGEVTLSWTASPSATVYRVYRSTKSGNEANPALAVGLLTTSYVDTAVITGVTYYYKVTAANVAGASSFSNEAVAPHYLPPAAPSLTATLGTSGVTLNWTSSAGALVYRVYRGTMSGCVKTKTVALRMFRIVF